MKKLLFYVMVIAFFLCGFSHYDLNAQEKSAVQFFELPVFQGAVLSPAERTASSSFSEITEPEEQTKSSPAIKGRKALPLGGKVIVIDAGHGLFSRNRQEPVAPNSSKTKSAFVSGTSGKTQSEEQLNLKVSQKLDVLLRELGADVHMTRSGHETTLSNVGRAEFANDLNADLSVKLHADGSTNTSRKGISMLVPANQHVSSEVYSLSKNAGQIILDEVIKETNAINLGVVERNDLTGFNWSKVPLVLLEMGFMTNPQEDALLATEEYQMKIARGIANGVIKYFE